MKHITKKWILPWFQKRLPPLSAEEQAVLEAGGLWYDKEFFTGKPDWNVLFNLSKPRLTEDEKSFLKNEVETLCSLVDDWQVSHVENDLPKVAWDYIKSERFWGLTIPEKYNGHGFSAVAHSAIIARIATRSMALAYTVMVPNSLGVAAFIQQFGTDNQKDRYLPRLAKGEDISCFALTTAHAGSDATSISDQGIVCRGEFKGENVLGIRLTIDKRYITLAPVATLIGLAFKLSDPDGLLGDKKEYGISLALLPSDLPGLKTGTRHSSFGLGFMNGPIRGKDVFIPIDYLMGGVDYAGRGWEMMLACLSLGRGLSLPALSSGVSQVATRTSSAYAMIREQFRVPIGSFEGVQASLARVVGLTYLTEATRRFTASAVAEGKRPSVASAIAKYHLTEITQRIVIDAMDIHGGSAVQIGPKNMLSNLYLATQMNKTVEGANILTRNLIIFGQGVLRCHPHVRELIRASSESVSSFQKRFYAHVRFALKAFLRGCWQGLTGGRTVVVPDHPCARELKQLSRMSNALVLMTEFSLLKLGSQLKRREALSARLGDLLSQLYLAASVLKRFEDSDRDAKDLSLVQWSLSYCLHEMQRAVQDFLANFPSKGIVKLLEWVLFPWGLRYTYPSDARSSVIAKQIQEDLNWREHLTKACYVGQPTDVIAAMDKALKAILEEKDNADRLRNAVIQVDEFGESRAHGS